MKESKADLRATIERLRKMTVEQHEEIKRLEKMLNNDRIVQGDHFIHARTGRKMALLPLKGAQ